jgi:hypothetical protein
MEKKRIYFDPLSKGYWFMLMVISLILIVIGFTEPFEVEHERVYKYIGAIGFFLQALYFSKLFLHKNTVQWNNKGIVLRIESFLGNALRFDQIKSTELNGKTLTLTNFDGEKITLNLNDFSESDAHKLNEIFVKNTIAKHV